MDAPANTSSKTTTYFFQFVVFVLLLIGLYYLYQFLYGSTSPQASVPLVSGTVSTAKTTTDALSGQQAVSVVNVSPVYDGGQYSVSFWTYIQDTKGFVVSGGSTPLAHLMEISNNRFGKVVTSTSGSATKNDTTNVGNTLIYIGLNPINGSLIVRQSTAHPTEQINNAVAGTAATGTTYSLSSLINNYNTGSTYTSDDRCDILNGVEYQRWLLITVVANARTLDVYIDGKLARSCVYKANYAMGGAKGNSSATAMFGVNNAGNLKGYFANGNFFNYALTPDAVWSIYQAGPGTSGSGFFANLFSTNIVLGSSSGMAS